MFEQAISELEAMGLPYQENEDGTLVIDISTADKTDVVTIVGFLNDNGMDYTIDANAITVMGLPEAPEMPEEDMVMDDAMAGAMGELY
jgi:hypothetical protein